MTKIDKKLILELEKLSRLKLSENEKVQITKDLKAIVEMFDSLQEVNTEGVEPLRHISQNVNQERNDIVEGELEKRFALDNVPKKKNRFIAVPKFLNPK